MEGEDDAAWTGRIADELADTDAERFEAVPGIGAVVAVPPSPEGRPFSAVLPPESIPRRVEEVEIFGVGGTPEEPVLSRYTTVADLP